MLVTPSILYLTTTVLGNFDFRSCMADSHVSVRGSRLTRVG